MSLLSVWLDNCIFSDIIYDILRRCRSIFISNQQRITFSVLNEGAKITFSEKFWHKDHIHNHYISAGYKAKTSLSLAETIIISSVSADNRANNAIGRFVNKEAHSLKEEKDTDCLNSDIMPNYRIQKVLQLVKYRILPLGLFVDYRI